MEVLKLANAYLNLYMNNPTAGGTDGTAISTGDYTAPFSFRLDAAQSETKTATLAIRAGTGYQTSGNTVISDSNDTADKWKLSLDGETWSDTIVFSDTITAVNTIFHVKASSDGDEAPQTDRSVKLNVQAIVVAAV